MLLQITRNATTSDAYFGNLSIDGNLECRTMERIAVSIPRGNYTTTLKMSPRFGFVTPHLDVPGRTFIEMHPANYPCQLEGCIAVGEKQDGDAVDNSRAAFEHIVPQIYKAIVAGEPVITIVQ